MKRCENFVKNALKLRDKHLILISSKLPIGVGIKYNVGLLS